MSTTHPITADELLREGSRIHCELIEGEVVEMTPAGAEHGIIAGEITGRLYLQVAAAKLGRVCTAEIGYLVGRDPDTVRVPDVSFLSNESLHRHGIPRGYFPGPPDLAVEVVSPHDRVGDVDAKIEMWMKAGTRLVWVIYPGRRMAEVYQPDRPVERVGEGDSLSGRDVLPGFACPLREVLLP